MRAAAARPDRANLIVHNVAVRRARRRKEDMTMPHILEETSVTVDDVRLSDGRLARVQGYNPERTRFVADFMTRTVFPPVWSPAVVLVHSALLALAAVETIDGEPLAWPEPTFTGVDRLVQSVRESDLEMLARRYGRSLPLGVQIRPFWKVAAEGWDS